MIWKKDMERLLGPNPIKPLTIEQLGFTQQSYIAYRKGLLDKIRVAVGPAQAVEQVVQQIAQQQQAAQKAAQQQQAAQKAAQQQQAATDPTFTGVTMMVKNTQYKQVTDGIKKWWQDPYQEPHFTIPIQAAGSRTRRRQSRRHRII